ncbi:CAP domain-containing protein [Singulisphaera sp. Ch08]|uniref:CAP domain-containing protein n=1 Tax=Singulisphaera sp. Ch08 TaxID=3120278 RepID=A0AAU7CKJ5_9BACT
MPFATLLKMSTVLPFGILGLAMAATQPAQAQQAAPATAAVARPAQTAPVAPAGDPYGFTAWLNATRASYGLPPVGYDPNLTNWASANNGQQQARGMGHHVMGPARRQNAAMGQYASIGAMWMNSPAHRAALLDPSIRWIGIAGLGAYWTFNAY